MLGLRPKVGVGDAQAMVSAQLEQSLSILVHFTHVELSKAGVPRVAICAHSGIEVAQENDSFIVGDAAEDGGKVLVELVFGIHNLDELSENLTASLQENYRKMTRVAYGHVMRMKEEHM